MMNEQEQLEQLFKQLPQRTVPDELTARINERIHSTKRRAQRHKIAKRSIIAAASAAVVFTSSVMLSPSVAVYAKQVPGLSAAVTWLETTGELLGIRHAKEHGYVPVESFRTQWGRNTVMVENIYYEEERLFYTVTIQGAGIAEEKANPNKYAGKLRYTVIPPKFDLQYQSPNFTRDELVEKQLPTVQSEQEPDDVLTIIGDVWVSERELQNRYAEDNNHKLEMVLERIDHSGEQPAVEQLKLEVPLSMGDFKPTHVTKVNQVIHVEDPVIKQLQISKLKLMPTRMELEIESQLHANGVISLISPVAFDPERYNHLRLEDDSDMKYPLSASSPDAPPGLQHVSRWSFIPSLYFEEQARQLKLHIDRIWVSSIQIENEFILSMRKPFPQTAVFKGKQITILGATYKEGYLYLDVQADDDGNNPWAGALLTYEPYYLKMQQNDKGHKWWEKAGLNIHTPEVEQIPETAQQLFERYSGYARVSKSSFLTWGLLGLVSDNYEMRKYSSSKQSSYELKIMAPDLDEYSLSIRRYGDPVEVNETITIRVPANTDIKN